MGAKSGREEPAIVPRVIVNIPIASEPKRVVDAARQAQRADLPQVADLRGATDKDCPLQGQMSSVETTADPEIGFFRPEGDQCKQGNEQQQHGSGINRLMAEPGTGQNQ